MRTGLPMGMPRSRFAESTLDSCGLLALGSGSSVTLLAVAEGVKVARIQVSGRICAWLPTALMVIAVSATLQQPPRERFQLPDRTYDADGRSFANLGWITVRWSAVEDERFTIVNKEVAVLRTYAGSRADRTDWAGKTRRAYAEWLVDCQDPVKLFSACAYYGGVQPSLLGTHEFQRVREDLHLGWYVLRKPPASYLFVRMGYKWCAGDGDRHLFGDLARALLKQDPNDRATFRAAVRELWDERPRWNEKTKRMVQLKEKGEGFEDFLITTGLRLRKTDVWRPWDDACVSDIYVVKALRTKRLTDWQKAAAYNESAIKNSPPDFDAGYLREARASIQRAKRWMVN